MVTSLCVHVFQSVGYTPVKVFYFVLGGTQTFKTKVLVGFKNDAPGQTPVKSTVRSVIREVILSQDEK